MLYSADVILLPAIRQYRNVVRHYMKLQEINFNRSIKLFQVFRNINLYGKQQKSIVDRSADIAWTSIMSKSGYIVENKLYLPEQILENAEFNSCNLITIEDDQQPNIFTPSSLQYTRVFGQNVKAASNNCLDLSKPAIFDIFEFRTEEEVELYLNYGYFEVGIPKRNNFKLCEIRKNCPIEIKINGKTDHSMSRGRERIFKEQYYVFDYVGDFDSCYILKEPFKAVEKNTPTITKTIDLIKQLW